MILYLCDGKVENCKKDECYRNGGKCRHTTQRKNRKKADGTQMIIVGKDNWEMDSEGIKELINDLIKGRNERGC